MAGWKKTGELMAKIKHYSMFPATGVSLRQMVGASVLLMAIEC